MSGENKEIVLKYWELLDSLGDVILSLLPDTNISITKQELKELHQKFEKNCNYYKTIVNTFMLYLETNLENEDMQGKKKFLESIKNSIDNILIGFDNGRDLFISLINC